MVKIHQVKFRFPGLNGELPESLNKYDYFSECSEVLRKFRLIIYKEGQLRQHNISVITHPQLHEPSPHPDISSGGIGFLPTSGSVSPP